MRFVEELRQQRWDDHRYYHHSRINQSLHLVSAISFLFSYVMIFKDPAMAALVGWLLAMVLRQSGHFFFEPKTFDEVNHASHAYKERVKVGYNLKRKVILHAVWLAAPLAIWFDTNLFHFFTKWMEGMVFRLRTPHLGHVYGDPFPQLGKLDIPFFLLIQIQLQAHSLKG